MFFLSSLFAVLESISSDDPFYMKWWFLVIISLVGLILILIVVAVLLLTGRRHLRHLSRTGRRRKGSIFPVFIHTVVFILNCFFFFVKINPPHPNNSTAAIRTIVDTVFPTPSIQKSWVIYFRQNAAGRRFAYCYEKCVCLQKKWTVQNLRVGA